MISDGEFLLGTVEAQVREFYENCCEPASEDVFGKITDEFIEAAKLIVLLELTYPPYERWQPHWEGT
jgi:hypothetical protein